MFRTSNFSLHCQRRSYKTSSSSVLLHHMYKQPISFHFVLRIEFPAVGEVRAASVHRWSTHTQDECSTEPGNTLHLQAQREQKNKSDPVHQHAAAEKKERERGRKKCNNQATGALQEAESLHHLQSEEKSRLNSSQEHRVRELEAQYADATTLLHVQGSLLSDLQVQILNLSMLVEKVHRNPGCMINIVRTSPLLSNQHTLHPEMQHVRNCPIDCASIYYNGVRRSGIYTVVPSLGAMPVEVYCDMDTDGGGWTVIQRRQDGSVKFDRGWKEYKDGFGDLRTEYWLGNRHIHDLSTQGDYVLRVDMEDWSGKRKHALYQNFRIEDEAAQYRLHISGFSGTVEDSFSWYHDKQDFSTPDTGNICAEISHAGWWYNQCFYANLNGVYHKGGRYAPKGKNTLGPNGIVWFTWKDTDYYSLRKVAMMIRPRTFRPHLSP
ncbi:angiopoietin-related protein 7 isoform X2 [Silurus meridionalis]|uniref:angiopoietin-related protein 7 isoform X2 n=1 Tax=Silurus meridionalis TaxID=175797 RepID=UPI001EEA3A3F|nr:angiopoietin-related protein 7 isoform X2 [Silurus meridionalis]